MLSEKIKPYNLILASGSPRRQQLLNDLGLDFEIRLKPVVEEYPDRLRHFEISDYLAQLKSLAFEAELKPNDILITSDTIVWHKDRAIGKPISKENAFAMIKSLSGDVHEVITSICFKTTTYQKTVNTITKVHFAELTDDEIAHYLDNYEFMDKAGAYGIQDWIGLVAVTHLEGSYLNVMGFPIHLVYKTLNDIVSR
ncbi:MAG: septum formation protein Maf [Bacteroidia bacterium]|nr:septum formation protein Maf [Bacteroidia bacterium]MBT8279683.1 septum formation protein Maf [Bacteroidia bacterium]NND25491.1 septum formation protein Maf [Flavobacteriaceae bacterium]NNK60994.1 septum formation protein Maf [Flavobacteriaceae bacterium]